jgi:hypothetical protein
VQGGCGVGVLCDERNASLVFHDSLYLSTSSRLGKVGHGWDEGMKDGRAVMDGYE